MKYPLTMLALGAFVVLTAVIIYFAALPDGTQALWSLSQGGTWLLPLVTIGALIDSINPCAVSILFVTIAFAVSIGMMRKRMLLIGGAYIFGLYLVYLAIGFGILEALHLFNTPRFMSRVGSVLLVALGIINVTQVFFPKFPIKLKIPAATHAAISRLIDRASVPAAFGMGVLVGLCEFPCTGGPYLQVLALLHDNATRLTGTLYLLYYNVVFVLPLIVMLSLAGSTPVREKIEKWQAANRTNLRFISGLAMVALGIVIWLI